MSDPIFDEFGNLIEEDDGIGNDIEDVVEEEEDNDDFNHHNGVNGGDDQDRMHVEEDDEEEEVEFKTRTSNAIVLHEDKNYYPDASTLYGKDVEVMVQDEDTQPITKPIIAPDRKKSFTMVDKELPQTVYDKQYLLDMMAYPNLIRNICLLGNLHSGKTTLMDMLVTQTHEKKWTHSKSIKYTDTRSDEQERGLSIKATPMSLVLPNSSEKSYLLNILDCPGHINFSDESTASIRLSDGAVIVIDAVEGVMMQTERLITHAAQEGLAISIIINKMDRLLLELKLPPQDAYFKLKHTIDQVNAVLEKVSHGKGSIKTERVSPELGNVLFASGEMGWCFTLLSFAKLYHSAHGGFAPDEFAKRLWGDLYLHPKERVIRRKPPTNIDIEIPRTFVQFILIPLYKLYSTILSEDEKTISRVLLELGIKLNKETLNLDVKPLLRIVLSSFFGKAAGFVDMVVGMPSPLEGAKDKIERIYTGPLNGVYGESMIQCNPDGPLMIYITKLLTSSDGSRFDCLGRVMSGTARKGDVRILGERYQIENNEEDVVVDEITNISIGEARYKIGVDNVPAGMWVLLEGVDNSIIKTATITDVKDKGREEYDRAHTFLPLVFNTKSVCKVAIEPLNPSELPKMLDALRKINKSYPLAITRAEDSGEHIIMGTGELYLDCILHDLRVMYGDIEIKVDDPVISLAETVVETSAIKCTTETQNKRNKVTMICEPLDKGLAEDIESGLISIDVPQRDRIEFFKDKYGWDILTGKNIWAFGPESNGANILINDTIAGEVNRQHLTAISESVIRGFQWATKEGPLVDEPVRNVKFKLVDALIAPEPIYRTSGHIVPASRSSTHATILVATPRLMEPVYKVEIVSPPDCVQAIEAVLTRRRGHIIHDYPKPGTPLYITNALLPVLDSYGFETDLRSHTQGQAFCCSVFNHWQLVPGDPLDKSITLMPLEPSPQQHLARELLIKTRRRKGLSEDVNLSKHFNDEQLLTIITHLGDTFISNK